MSLGQKSTLVEEINDQAQNFKSSQNNMEEQIHSLPPPNPILNKKDEEKKLQEELKLGFKKLPESKKEDKIEETKYNKQQSPILENVKNGGESQEEDNVSESGSEYNQEVFDYGIQAYYDKQNYPLIYKKLDIQNEKKGNYLQRKYFAGLFFDVNKLVQIEKDEKIIQSYNVFKLVREQIQNENNEFLSQQNFALHSTDQVATSNSQISNNRKQMVAKNKSDLVFDSNFESGNLFAVFKLKNDSLFNYGLHPACYSLKRQDLGWQRSGFNIYYEKNQIQKESNPQAFYYTLSFSYSFKNSKDTVYFAQCYPYTYTDLQNYLSKLTSDNQRSKFVKRQVLCQTLAKTNCDLLTITHSNDTNKSKKQVIFLMARQHPGETPGSFMMEGMLDFLTDPINEEAIFLRKAYIFKIIPMINPDGVIHGNYRCSLSGVDLNRQWINPNKLYQPTVFYTKNLFNKLQNERTIRFVCDLHGHSKKMNSFFYGNPCVYQPSKPKVIPMLASRLNPHISFKDCTFKLTSEKSSAARQALFQETGINCIYTFEASFYGYINAQNEKYHFSINDYKNLGRSICQTLYKIAVAEVDYVSSSTSQQQQKQLVEKSLEQLSEELKLLPANDNQNDNLSGSESDPQIDELSTKEIKHALKSDLNKEEGECQKRLSSSPSKCMKKTEKTSSENCQHTQNMKIKVQQSNLQKSDVQTQTDDIFEIIQISSKFYGKFLEQNLSSAPEATFINYNNISLNMPYNYNNIRYINSLLNNVNNSMNTFQNSSFNCNNFNLNNGNYNNNSNNLNLSRGCVNNNNNSILKLEEALNNRPMSQTGNREGKRQLPAINVTEQREVFKPTLINQSNRSKAEKKKILNQQKPLTLFELQAYNTYSNLQQAMGEGNSEQFKRKLKNLQITFQNGNVIKVQNYKLRHQQTQTYITLVNARIKQEYSNITSNNTNFYFSDRVQAQHRSSEMQKCSKYSEKRRQESDTSKIQQRNYSETQPSCNLNSNSSNNANNSIYNNVNINGNYSCSLSNVANLNNNTGSSAIANSNINNNTNNNNNNSKSSHCNNGNNNGNSLSNNGSHVNKQGNLLTNIFQYDKNFGKLQFTPKKLHSTLNNSIKIYGIRPKQQKKLNNNTSFDQSNSKLNINPSNNAYNPNSSSSQMKSANNNNISQIVKKNSSIINKSESANNSQMIPLTQNEYVRKRYQKAKNGSEDSQQTHSLFDTQQNFNLTYNQSTKQDLTQLYSYNIEKLQQSDNQLLQRRQNERNKCRIYDDQRILEQLIQIPKQELSYDLQQLNKCDQLNTYTMKNSMPIRYKIPYSSQQQHHQQQQFVQIKVQQRQPPLKQQMIQVQADIGDKEFNDKNVLFNLDNKNSGLQQSVEFKHFTQVKDTVQKNIQDKKNFASFSLKHAHNFRQARNSQKSPFKQRFIEKIVSKCNNNISFNNVQSEDLLYDN